MRLKVSVCGGVKDNVFEFNKVFNPKKNRRGYRKKMNLLEISRFPDFIQCFPDFSLTKFFKVSERCGTLNPCLNKLY